MAALLKAAVRQRDAPAHVRRLLAAAAPPEARATGEESLIEPLSERELDVLRLLESDLDGPDIARELSVSLPTVRTHTSNIYAKLGVTNRRAAVRPVGQPTCVHLCPPRRRTRTDVARRGTSTHRLTAHVAPSWARCRTGNHHATHHVC